MHFPFFKYLELTKVHRNASIVLVLCIVLLSLVPIFKLQFFPNQYIIPRNIDSLITSQKLNGETMANHDTLPVKPFIEAYSEPKLFHNKIFYKEKNKELTPFDFDPNIASEEQLNDLGLSAFVVGNILKYRNAGGRYYSAAQFANTYGLSPDDAEILLTYIKIEKPNYSSQNQYTNKATKYTPSKKSLQVDINSADTSIWATLPFIGAKLSSRIVKYKESLGGFHSIDQVSEVYGLQDSVYQKIKKYLILDNIELKKININTLNEEDWKHPYIKKHIAKAIVNYRKQHGVFQQIEDLQKVLLVDESLFQKIKPYLSL